MSESFRRDLNKMVEAWGTLRSGQRKYMALYFVVGIFSAAYILFHLFVWTLDYLRGEPLHKWGWGWQYFLGLMCCFAAFVAYLEVRMRQRR